MGGYYDNLVGLDSHEVDALERVLIAVSGVANKKIEDGNSLLEDVAILKDRVDEAHTDAEYEGPRE